jgi:hypothetical protein
MKIRYLCGGHYPGEKRYLSSAFSSHHTHLFSTLYSISSPLLRSHLPSGRIALLSLLIPIFHFPYLQFLSRFRFFYAPLPQRERRYITSTTFLYQPRSTRPILSVAIGQCGPPLNKHSRLNQK